MTKNKISGVLLFAAMFLNTSIHASVVGTYSIVKNGCEDDGGPIVITQADSNLTLYGGFDKVPGSYYGNLSGDTITFSHADGTCNGTINAGKLKGNCSFPEEMCSFEYIISE